MEPLQEDYARIVRRLLSKCKSVVGGRAKVAALADQYFSYVRYHKQLKEDWKEIIYIVRLIGPDRADHIIGSDSTGILRELADNSPKSEDVKGRLPLWKAMREYLRDSGESTVADIRAFLEWLGYENVTRQAIESAIKRHRDVFGSRPKGRERIVALKEQEESASSDD